MNFLELSTSSSNRYFMQNNKLKNSWILTFRATLRISKRRFSSSKKSNNPIICCLKKASSTLFHCHGEHQLQDISHNIRGNMLQLNNSLSLFSLIPLSSRSRTEKKPLAAWKFVSSCPDLFADFLKSATSLKSACFGCMLPVGDVLELDL